MILKSLLLIANIITAQVACLPGDAMQQKLAEQSGEQMIFSGSLSDGSLIELWANFDAGTWTVLSVRRVDPRQTLACMIAAGDGATVRKPERPGKPL